MSWLKKCSAAFRFLTIFPLPGSYGTAPDDLSGTPPFFPVVGIILGLVAGAAALVLWRFLPQPVAAVVLTLLLFSFSGALHLDGLADTADGFFSSRDRDQTLAIMRDSRIGVMGVVAVVMVLLVKVSCLSVLDAKTVFRAALLVPLTGRCSLVFMMAVLPYVRPGGGLATVMYGRKTGLAALGSMLILIVLSIFVLGVPGLIPTALAVGTVLLFCWYCYRKIGGATGDTLGAACEISEAALLLFVTIRM